MTCFAVIPEALDAVPVTAPHVLNAVSTAQVIGPSVRAYGMVITLQPGVICEPLTHTLDMIFLPQRADWLQGLASFFKALPQLVCKPCA